MKKEMLNIETNDHFFVLVCIVYIVCLLRFLLSVMKIVLYIYEYTKPMLIYAYTLIRQSILCLQFKMTTITRYFYLYEIEIEIFDNHLKHRLSGEKDYYYYKCYYTTCQNWKHGVVTDKKWSSFLLFYKKQISFCLEAKNDWITCGGNMRPYKVGTQKKYCYKIYCFVNCKVYSIWQSIHISYYYFLLYAKKSRGLKLW